MAFLVPADLARVDVTGAERDDYLETVTSQHLGDARPGEVRGALYLDAHGAPLAVFDVVVLPDVLALLTPADLADEIVEVLGGRTFLTDATFTRSDHVAVHLRGEGAAEVAAAAGLDVDPGRVARGEDGLLVVAREGGSDLVGPKDAVAEATAALREAGASDGDLDDYEAWRVSAGQPAWGREIVAPHLPEELGLLPTHVHLDKGCYPGQEAVARMWMLGRPRRRLAVVDVEGDGVAPGWEAGSGRRKVRVTSVAPDGGRALAFVPGDAAEGDRLGGDEDGPGVVVRRLVGEGLPVPGHNPTMTRRRDSR
jgi:tRNA-modifying protein YgfZ